jgi:IS5 family transposase
MGAVYTRDTTTAANVADSAVLADLLHGEETRVWGDQDCRGETEVIGECAPQAQDCTHRRYRYKDRIDEVERARNRTKRRRSQAHRESGDAHGIALTAY